MHFPAAKKMLTIIIGGGETSEKQHFLSSFCHIKLHMCGLIAKLSPKNKIFEALLSHLQGEGPRLGSPNWINVCVSIEYK